MAALYDTVSLIVADVGAELGLGTLTAAYPATDATTAQIQSLLKATGRRLVREYPWLQNLVDGTLTGDGATTAFALPDDFLRMEDGTGWNRTTRQPLRPVGPQGWESMKASTLTTALPVLFRPRRRMDSGSDRGAASFEFLVAPALAADIRYEYRSQYWVAAAAAAAVSLDSPTAPSHLVRIDPYLFSRALKLAWLRAKGFESTAAQQDFEAALDATRGNDSVAAPTLSLNGTAPTLPGANTPETGYGT